jgi:RsiW-degrading membrane proteinase PrsW (M82 family)
MAGTVAAIAVPVVAVAALTVPVVVVWLALVVLPRAGRATRTDVLCGLGCGMFAAGAASLLGAAVGQVTGVVGPARLVMAVPLVEEPLKALGIVAALGFGTVAAGVRLPLRRCAVVTVTVAATFAASENLGHLGNLLIVDGVRPGDWAEVAATLRVRGVLPPLGHLAETWPVGAAIWLASRAGRPARRLTVLLPGLAGALVIHAGWNWSAQRWWPDPWPLLAIIAGSAAAAATCYLAAARRQRREAHRVTAPGTAPAGSAPAGSAPAGPAPAGSVLPGQAQPGPAAAAPTLAGSRSSRPGSGWRRPASPGPR